MSDVGTLCMQRFSLQRTIQIDGNLELSKAY